MNWRIKVNGNLMSICSRCNGSGWGNLEEILLIRLFLPPALNPMCYGRTGQGFAGYIASISRHNHHPPFLPGREHALRTWTCAELGVRRLAGGLTEWGDDGMHVNSSWMESPSSSASFLFTARPPRASFHLIRQLRVTNLIFRWTPEKYKKFAHA